ncbi:MAG: hypothetical protein KAS95_06955 [Candidatus Heimdallarchaeota archaeon]|nr:hypothetical protein [Candidatus Heimdallarchaeota archaeon]
MSYKKHEEQLIKEFRDEVSKKLPIWLKLKVTELRETLDELESHIWDKAEELAKGEEPNAIHVREAIYQMGSPRDIAKEFKRRGTPRFYLSAELCPWYYKSLLIVGVIVLFTNLLTMAFTIGRSDNIGQIVGQTFEGIFDGFVIGFVVLSVIFVILSMQGFLPEDIRSKAKTTKELVTKTIKGPYKAPKVKSVLPSQGSFLFEGIIGMTIGFLLIFFPYDNYSSFYPFDMTQLIPWLGLLGGIMIFKGVIKFSQALVGKHVRFQQIFLGLSLIPSSLSIALFLQLHLNSAILRQPLLDLFPGADIALYIKIGVIVIVIGTIIGMVHEISRIIRLETRGFPELEMYETPRTY